MVVVYTRSTYEKVGLLLGVTRLLTLFLADTLH